VLAVGDALQHRLRGEQLHLGVDRARIGDVARLHRIGAEPAAEMRVEEKDG
jgi:hypothetical protein